MIQSADLENWRPDAIANPYHFSLDTLTILSDSARYTTFSGKTVVPPALSSSTKITTTNSLLFYVCLLFLLAVAIFGGSSRIHFTNFLKIGIFEKYMQDHEKKQVSNNPQFNNFLWITTLFFLSVIFYTYFCHHATIEHPFLIFAYSLVITILLVCVKLLLHFLLGLIFNATDNFKEFQKIMRNMYSSSMLFWCLLCFMMLSSNTKTDYWICLIALIFFGVMYVFRDVKYLLKQITKKQSNIYFFIYFCTLEILSIPVLIKTLYFIDNQVFVELF